MAWRNSLVFHSLDKTTSVYLHVLPAVVSYVWRWSPEQQAECLRTGSCHLSLLEWFGFPLAFYTIWQVLYLLYTEVLMVDHLNADPALETSLRYLARSPGGLANVSRRVCRALGILAP